MGHSDRGGGRVGAEAGPQRRRSVRPSRSGLPSSPDQADAPSAAPVKMNHYQWLKGSAPLWDYGVSYGFAGGSYHGNAEADPGASQTRAARRNLDEPGENVP